MYTPTRSASRLMRSAILCTPSFVLRWKRTILRAIPPSTIFGKSGMKPIAVISASSRKTTGKVFSRTFPGQAATSATSRAIRLAICTAHSCARLCWNRFPTHTRALRQVTFPLSTIGCVQIFSVTEKHRPALRRLSASRASRLTHRISLHI